MIMVRFADDIVCGFQNESDARRFWEAMRKRLQEFSLSLHPVKTRLIEFGRFAAINRKQRGLGKPETFTSLVSFSYADAPCAVAFCKAEDPSGPHEVDAQRD